MFREGLGLRKKRALRVLCIVFGCLLVIGSVLFCLVWNGIILLNNPSTDTYPVRGVDVSSYQGDIDWETLSSQGISFAFIKATEGSGFVDERFAYNYSRAQKAGLRVGAYHFFSYDSPGETQAERFIRTVPVAENMLPPVIDIEFYGDKEQNPPGKEETTEQLTILIDRLEAHYGKKPILYATEKSYELYIAGGFPNCDIWIRNVVTAPRLSDQRQWTFWQYTNRAVLDGYHGEEKYIDRNVFYGSESDFMNYKKGRYPC